MTNPSLTRGVCLCYTRAMNNYNFSNRTTSLKPSAIREIFKYSADPAVIPFSAGNPSSASFPVEAIADITAGILRDTPASALQYGITEGYAPLREWVKADLALRLGIGSASDDLIIVSGSQQGIDLTSKAFLNPGDTVICESPSFIGSLNAFRTYEANLVGIPLEDDGMDIAALEQACQENANAKIIYTIPNFQNPSGVTTSYAKRKAIYDIAVKYGLVIVEDNPYGELRFEGEDVPAIKTFDEAGIVIYCGSFSKTLSPGLRVGFVAANAEITQKITVLKQTNDVHTNVLAQMIAYEYLTKYDYSAHLAGLRALYKAQRDLIVSEAREHFPTEFSFSSPQGGLFLWVKCPDGFDADAFCRMAVAEHKVACVPGSAFSPSGESLSALRLNYSTPTAEQIVQGVRVLGEIL